MKSFIKLATGLGVAVVLSGATPSIASSVTGLPSVDRCGSSVACTTQPTWDCIHPNSNPSEPPVILSDHCDPYAGGEGCGVG
jgi:hypothetical protein